MSFSQFTIEQALSHCGRGWKALLCTTYGLDPEVLQFIYNRYLRESVDQGCVHILGDARKIDELTVNPADCRTFAKLLKEISIGSEVMPGSFHPKIFFFASDEKLALLLLTGNITAGGILSGIDIFSYVELDRGNKDIFLGAYNFLKGMKGWNSYARVLMENIEKNHPWIINGAQSNSRFLYTSKQQTLIEQMRARLGKAKVQKLRVFTPFVSLNANLFSELRGNENYPVEIYLGREEVEVSHSGAVKDLMKHKISFMGPNMLNVWPFHAKVYNFLTSKGQVTFWGSANCTLSALHIPGKNSEYLIQSNVSTEDLESMLFVEDPKVYELMPVEKEPLLKNKEPLCEYTEVISHCLMEEDILKLAFNDLPKLNLKALIKCSDGAELIRDIRFDNSRNGTVRLDGNFLPVFVSPYFNDRRCGPWAFVLDENKIFNRSGGSPSKINLTQGIAKVEIASLLRVRNCLEFIKDDSVTEIITETKKKSKKGNQPIELWIPKRQIGGVAYRSTYALFPRKRRWESDDDVDPTEDKPDEAVKESKINDSYEYDPIDYLSEEIGHVMKRIASADTNKTVVVKESLAIALEHYCQFLLRDFSQNEYSYDVDALCDCVSTFGRLSQMICFLYQPITSSHFDSTESALERTAGFGAVIYLNYITAHLMYHFKVNSYGSPYALEDSEEGYLINLRNEATTFKCMFDYFNSSFSTELLPKIKEHLDFLDRFVPPYLMRSSVHDEAYKWTKPQLLERPVKELKKGDWFFTEKRGLIQCIDPFANPPRFFNGGYQPNGENVVFSLSRDFFIF